SSSVIRRAPRATPCPYTTLFRSRERPSGLRNRQSESSTWAVGSVRSGRARLTKKRGHEAGGDGEQRRRLRHTLCALRAPFRDSATAIGAASLPCWCALPSRLSATWAVRSP